MKWQAVDIHLPFYYAIKWRNEHSGGLYTHRVGYKKKET
jgi:hypothetical protein